MPITINGSGTLTGVSVGGLPDGTVDNDTIANTTIAVGKLAAGVNTIRETDIWRLSTTFDSSGTFITTNWERADHDGAEKIGTGMSESSGVFTFPSTGIWNIKACATATKTGGNIRYAGGYLNTTINNSSYVEAGIALSHLRDTTNACWASCVTETNFDVTDVSQCKCKLYLSSASTVSWVGSSTINYTFLAFTRLGDT